MKKEKDMYSTNVEADAEELMDDTGKEAPAEHELDMCCETMMKAEKIKGDARMMKHLRPYMAEKMKHMKGVMGEEAPSKITSIEGLKAKAKTL